MRNCRAPERLPQRRRRRASGGPASAEGHLLVYTGGAAFYAPRNRRLASLPPPPPGHVLGRGWRVVNLQCPFLSRHPCFFKNNFVFLVLLALLKCFLVPPTQVAIAAIAINVRNLMKPRIQDTLLSWTKRHIHDRVEQISTTRSALKGFRNNIFVVRKMSSTITAGIYPSARQVRSVDSAHRQNLLIPSRCVENQKSSLTVSSHNLC
mmetsp:Transcript_44811/g.93855  ORF Transcript_44811/g.93855 Transcript_44811/m.93855 type:complete len:207 (-) Transcript_44811:255-875(-)